MNKIKTIYIAGGGTRGIAFIGALQALKDQKLLDYCETIIGTSIGAMIGTGLSLNVPLQEMYKIFYNFNLTTGTDINIENLLTNFGLDCGKKFLLPFIKTFTKYISLYCSNSVPKVKPVVVASKPELAVLSEDEIFKEEKSALPVKL